LLLAGVGIVGHALEAVAIAPLFALRVPLPVHDRRVDLLAKRKSVDKMPRSGEAWQDRRVYICHCR
jgi:hypothetical protein